MTLAEDLIGKKLIQFFLVLQVLIYILHQVMSVITEKSLEAV